MDKGRTSDTDFELICFVVEQRSKEGEFIRPDELAGLIMTAADRPLPEWLRELTAAHLRGEAKRPRGRPKRKNEWQERFVPLAKLDYDRLLLLLQRRAKRRKKTRKPSRLDWPPHEIALELVHQHYKNIGEFRTIDLKRFRDLIFPSKTLFNKKAPSLHR